MILKTSWDDGTEWDLRTMRLLKKYKIDGIFFVPIKSWGFDNLEVYKDFEVGCHTFSHPQDLKLLSDAMLDVEIIVAKEILEKKLGKKVEWFCYPRGRFNEQVKKKVAKAGFKFARTTNIKNGFDKLEFGGLHCYQRKEYNGVDWLEYIKKYVHAHPLNVINIWGHSKEIEKYNEWNKLETLFKFICESRLYS